MVRDEVEKTIGEAVAELKDELGDFGSAEIPLEHPENEEYGDYATSVAFVIAKQGGKNPQEIAAAVAAEIEKQKPESIEKVEAVGGFVNFFVSKNHLLQELEHVQKEGENYGKTEAQKGKKIMVEYAHPNTHKEMHIGHMRTLITGEALCRIFEANGAEVFRANYQGDIGPHVAKALWGTEQLLQERNMSWDEAGDLSLAEKAYLLGEGYVKGNQEYEAHEDEIDAINGKLYERSDEVTPLYEKTRQWSLDYYDELYERFDTKFDKLYFESQVADSGKKIVKENIGKVFEESDGAVIFDGEKYGLHKRVFITKDDNPTYEAKDIGLAPMQYGDFPFDKSVHVVANEQTGYFQVVFRALELLDSKFADREYHLPMGMVNLVGAKMSSRTGVVITVDGLLGDVKSLTEKLIDNDELSAKEREGVAEATTIAAVKYSVLRTDTKSNVAFDLEKSVSLEGDSGPYLQYTYARCKSILHKSKAQSASWRTKINSNTKIQNFSKEEMAVLRMLYRFEEVVQEAGERFAPNHVCSYIFELAQKYNNFYNTHRVLEAETEEQKQFRLQLTSSVAQILKNGLYLLGIQAPEKM